LQPRLNRFVLSIEIAHIRHQILYNIHVRKRMNLYRLVQICINFTVERLKNLTTEIHQLKSIIECYLMHARELQPPIFIAQEPQMPSLHDLLNVSVGSISLLILIKASRTIGPHL
jgi:hypothetical protein